MSTVRIIVSFEIWLSCLQVFEIPRVIQGVETFSGESSGDGMEHFPELSWSEGKHLFSSPSHQQTYLAWWLTRRMGWATNRLLTENRGTAMKCRWSPGRDSLCKAGSPLLWPQPCHWFAVWPGQSLICWGKILSGRQRDRLLSWGVLIASKGWRVECMRQGGVLCVENDILYMIQMFEIETVLL